MCPRNSPATGNNCFTRQLFVWLTIAPLLLMLGAGCQQLPKQLTPSTAPKAEVESVRGTNQGKDVAVTPAELQAELMRYADEYMSAIAEATADFYVRVPTPTARAEAQEWKLTHCSSAIVIASGENSSVNLLDMIVLVTLGRIVQEDHWVGKTYGETAQPILDTYRQLEEEIWAIADRVIEPAQQTELRQLISEWRTKNLSRTKVGLARFQEFANSIGKTPEEGRSRPDSIFSLFFVDPLAGLDPAAKELALTRQFAERTLYQFQRMPILMSWHVELLFFRLTETPEMLELRGQSERLTQSIEIISQTAEKLPDVIDRQREAAIQQILAGVAVERTNILASIASEEKRLRGVLTELRQTLNAGDEMATSVNIAVKTLDTFIAGFDKGTNAPAPSTNSKPFDITEYGATAADIAGAARELNGLATSADQMLPKLVTTTGEVNSQVKQQIQHAFWLGLVLILTLLIGAVLAALLYRGLARKLFPASGK